MFRPKNMMFGLLIIALTLSYACMTFGNMENPVVVLNKPGLNINTSTCTFEDQGLECVKSIKCSSVRYWKSNEVAYLEFYSDKKSDTTCKLNTEDIKQLLDKLAESGIVKGLTLEDEEKISSNIKKIITGQNLAGYVGYINKTEWGIASFNCDLDGKCYKCREQITPFVAPIGNDKQTTEVLTVENAQGVSGNAAGTTDTSSYQQNPKMPSLEYSEKSSELTMMKTDQGISVDNEQKQPGSLVTGFGDYLPIISGMIGLSVLGIIVYMMYERTKNSDDILYTRVFESDTRSQILQCLSDIQRIPTDVATIVGKSKSTVVEHLEFLLKEGLVEKLEEPGKKFVYYRLTSRGKELLRRKRAAS